MTGRAERGSVCLLADEVHGGFGANEIFTGTMVDNILSEIPAYLINPL
jgi:hypothetical protein